MVFPIFELGLKDLRIRRIGVSGFSAILILALGYIRAFGSISTRTLFFYLYFPGLHALHSRRHSTRGYNIGRPLSGLVFLSMPDIYDLTIDFRPATFDFRPSTYDLRPSTFDLQPTIHNFLPSRFLNLHSINAFL